MKSQRDQLDRIANSTGGGLSTAVTGQYTSVRHAKALADGKLTMGRAAQRIYDAVGKRLRATKVKDMYIAHFGRDPEWHHSGFYKGSRGMTMGRTYFMTEAHLAELIANYDTLVNAVPAVSVIDRSECWCAYYIWKSDYNGRYGRKRNYKVLQFYHGPASARPANAISLTEAEYTSHLHLEGKEYHGWDEPKKHEFQIAIP